MSAWLLLAAADADAALAAAASRTLDFVRRGIGIDAQQDAQPQVKDEGWWSAAVGDQE